MKKSSLHILIMKSITDSTKKTFPYGRVCIVHLLEQFLPFLQHYCPNLYRTAGKFNIYKRPAIKIFLSALLIISSIRQPINAQTAEKDTLVNTTFTKIAMQEDFNYLKRALLETHPGLYRYNTKEQLTGRMDSLYSLLTANMKFYDYYRLLAVLISSIRCAHTNVLPTSDLNDMLKKCKTLPYWVFFIEGRVYITGVGTSDTTIKPGYELLSINGQSIDSVKTSLFNHLWSDGYINISKERMLDENFFALFYYLFIGEPEIYTVQCRTATGEIIEHTVSSGTYPTSLNNLAHNSVNEKLLKAIAKRNRLNQQKPWRVEINKEQNAAVMTIRGFGGGKNGDEAAQKMRAFMDVSMETLKKNNISNLIIDLRLNQGGWDIQGEELFTYLIDTPAYYYKHFHTVTNNSDFLKFSSVSKEELKNISNELAPETDGTFTVKEAFNSTLLLQHPKPNRFKGKVYFLQDGASGSTTAEFIAVAHHNKLGTFIGEECAGNYTGGNGGEFILLTLPITKIQVSIPLLYYQNAVDTPLQKGRGTIPDYYVPYNLEDILSATDTQLNYAYRLIKNGK